MKAFLVLALFAVVYAYDPVNVVDNTNGVHVVDNNHYGVNVVDNNRPDQVHVVDNNHYGVNVVDNNRPDQVHVVDNNPADQVIIANPDQFFYQGGQGGQQQPSIGPEFVQRPPYPYKHQDNPYLRSGH